MTYRERRERRAERLSEWAAKRESDAGAVLKSHEVYRGDHAFNFQPGHIPERARVIAQADRAFQSLDKAEDMSSRAAGIEAQLRTSIYDDDPDAVEQLTAKVARLEAKREAMKKANADYRRAHKAELAGMGVYDRGQALPHASYELSNLGATIRTARQRLERLSRPAGLERPRQMLARFSSQCEGCGEAIEKGSVIHYYKRARVAFHAACDEEG